MAHQTRASFEMHRPVVDGGEHIVQIVSGLARTFFPPDISDAAIIPTTPGERAEIVGTERLLVYPELRLPLVSYGANGQKDMLAFFNAAGRLTKAAGRIRNSTSSSPLAYLPERLQQIRLQHDTYGCSELPVCCSGVVVSEPPQGGGYEFGLAIEHAQFLDEHTAIVLALQSMGRMRGIVGAKERFTPVVPVALTVGNTTAGERSGFTQALLLRVPSFALKLGEIALPQVN